MKVLFSLLAILILNKECEQNKSADTSETTMNSEKTSNVAQDNTIIWYEATTRGFYEKIWVTKDSITVTNDRDLIEKTSFTTQSADWNELTTLLKEVDLKALPELEAPTSLRHHDGAAFATLGVTKDKAEIISNSFDNGYPPKAIEAVVNKVLSMKAKHQKN